MIIIELSWKDKLNDDQIDNYNMKKKELGRHQHCYEKIEIRCLIFDFDGTLAETEEAHRKAFNKAFQSNKLGWIWSKYIYKRLLQVAGGKERIEFYNKNYLLMNYQQKHLF